MTSILFHHKFKFVFYEIITIIMVFLYVYIIILMQDLINCAANGDTKQIIDKMIFAVIISAILGVIILIQMLLGKHYQNKCICRLREAYCSKLLSLNYADISHIDSSKHISAMTNDAEIIYQKFFGSFLDLGNTFVYCLASCAAMFIISPIMAAIVIVFTLLMAIIPGLLKGTMDHNTYNYSNALQDFTSKIKEVLLGLDIIKENNAEDVFSSQLNDASRNINKKQDKLINILAAINSSTLVLNNFFLVAIVGIASLFVTKGKMPIGSVTAIMLFGMNFMGKIQVVAVQFVDIMSTSQIRKEMVHFISQDDDTRKHIRLTKPLLKMNQVGFHYNSSKANVLDDLVLTFEPGKKYLILGKSGSGKSTILKLLAKQIDTNYTGTIWADQENYDTLCVKSINQCISLAQQKSYLFKASLRDNIDLAHENDDEKLQKVLMLSDLNSFVDQLPDKLDTIIDEEVNQVSGGEKLRINLARALYKDSDIILLDEITSAVDQITASKIEANMLSIDKTVINVCHKFDPSTLPSYHEIIVIEKGKIAIKGSYAHIKANEVFSQYQYHTMEEKADF